jgi:hypothetical protein
LRTDLINLLERSQEHLTPKQSSEVKRLLKKYEGLFAASDSDYGRPLLRHLRVYEVVVLLDVQTL